MLSTSSRSVKPWWLLVDVTVMTSGYAARRAQPHRIDAHRGMPPRAAAVLHRAARTPLVGHLPAFRSPGVPMSFAQLRSLAVMVVLRDGTPCSGSSRAWPTCPCRLASWAVTDGEPRQPARGQFAIFSPDPDDERDESFHRVLHPLKLRVPGHQSGGRDRGTFPGGGAVDASEFRWTIRSDPRRDSRLREVEGGPARDTGRGTRTPAAPGLSVAPW